MPNNIQHSQIYVETILDLFRRASLTDRLNTECEQFDWNGHGDTLKVLLLKTSGMGDYQRDTGYPQGTIQAVWESVKLETDRGIRFGLDRADSIETLGLAIGRVAQNFVDHQMAPELDAYRFAKYANGGITGATQTLDHTNIIGAIDQAKSYMNRMNVPREGRLLFVNEDLEPVMNKALNRTWSNEKDINTETERYNGMDLIYVPSGRFHSEIELHTGSSGEWGYTPDGDELNFMLLYPRAVVQAYRINSAKYITADENQNKDSDEFMFRLLHDAFVLDRYKDGVYVNRKG